MSRNNYSSKEGNYRSNPDHGKHFVPGAEFAPDNAPQPLDHFKRGYRERTIQRERDMEIVQNDFYQSGESSRRGPGSYNDRSANDRYPRRESSQNGGSYSRPPHAERRSAHGDRGDDRSGRGQVIMGLDVQGLVDKLSRRDIDVFSQLDQARDENMAVFQSGKAVTAVISNLARRRNLRLANIVWDWVDSVGIKKNTFHYNSMISVCEKVREYRKALGLLEEMTAKGVEKNEVTFSSAISACEKCGQWRTALDLLDQMKQEGTGQTAIAYNAAISACEKGLVPHKALEIFEQMKREGVRPTVVTYSALISAAEKGQQWKLALNVLEEMKAAGHGANVIAYSAAISALSKGQMWHKALELFREIEATGGKPSIVTYNATMTALEKGLQWERALDLFDEMKRKNMPVTVVSYGSAISACEKGLQYRQCLEYLDEMTEMGIKKNVIIFGAAMSCMEKSCRADIAFQLMERMKLEGVAPNVHIYNSAISACARCNLWEKGYELFQEMDEVNVARDVVTYNAVLDAVSSQVSLGRQLFKEGVEKGFYSRVSRLGVQWLELDLHFLSLGGGEIALGWWFEECLVPYMVNTSKLESVQSISIVTGYGKTRSRGARLNDDGMRLRVKAMLKCMNIKETPQPNKGRIHIDKTDMIEEVSRNGGKIRFDEVAYAKFKEEETTANKYPDVPQRVRPRFRPARQGEGPPGTFVCEGDDQPPQNYSQGHEDNQHPPDNYQQERRESRHSSYGQEDKGAWDTDHRRSHEERYDDQRGGQGHGGRWRERDHQGPYDARMKRERDDDSGRGYESYRDQRNQRGHSDSNDDQGGYDGRRQYHMESQVRRSRDWDRGEYDRRDGQYSRDRYEDRGNSNMDGGSRREYDRPHHRDSYRDENSGRGDRAYADPPSKRQRHSVQFGERRDHIGSQQKRVSDSVLYVNRERTAMQQFATIEEGDPNTYKERGSEQFDRDERYQAEQPPPFVARGYSVDSGSRGYKMEQDNA
eukprot:Nitzschia sp. Nitz4//scaffold9_size221794//31510//35086//NITZ4_001323-RA/size221794-augustus-gene-0.121-mRNA-1//1//CDS//3329560932//7893//frame0